MVRNTNMLNDMVLVLNSALHRQIDDRQTDRQTDPVIHIYTLISRGKRSSS